MNKKVLLALLLLQTFAAISQSPYMLKDINNSTNPSNFSSNPSNLMAMGNSVYFSATNQANGNELWKSDGTLNGTTLVKDLNLSGWSNPSRFAVCNGFLFFWSGNNYNLYKTDGTTQGTVLVKENVIPGSSAVMNNVLYFVNDNTGTIWKTDGTPSGTVEIINNVYGATNLVAMGNTLFFVGDSGMTGQEIWKSDGTQAGTSLLKDIYVNNSSYPANLTVVNGQLLFSANNGTNGYELWKSDGTANGTVMVKDIYPNGSSSSPSTFRTSGNLLYFVASDVNGSELWISDGTAQGTAMAQNIGPGSNSANIQSLTVLNNVAYFVAYQAATGYELWKSDGTDAGTYLVKDIIAGSGHGNPQSLTAANNTVFFVAESASLGRELWKTDGTANGTVMVTDIVEGYGTPNISNITALNGSVFFSATDGINGQEIFKSDGTAQGTGMVKDINKGNAGGSPYQFKNVNNTLVFVGNDPASGTELWKSDGTVAGSTLLKDIIPGAGSSGPSSLTMVNGTLYFVASTPSNGYQIWKTNGTEAGTVMVTQLVHSTSSWEFPFTHLTAVGNTLFFMYYSDAYGRELWKTDGTSAGTVLVKDVTAGATSAYTENLTNVNGTLYFSVVTSTTNIQLWKSNGTTAGTTLVKTLFTPPGGSNWGVTYPQHFCDVNGTLYFASDNGTNGLELWKSNGTSAGTVIVKDIYTGSTGGSPMNLFNFNGTLYFRANGSSSTGYELWKSNGTLAGTVMVKDISAGSMSSDPMDFVVLNNILYFSAASSTTTTNGDRELWKTDGTAGGTVRVKDISEGDASSSPAALTNFNGSLYFRAMTDTYGSELWKSDGTAAGTVLVKDIAQGSGSSYPSSMTVVNSKLFFTASYTSPDGYAYGEELWTMDNCRTTNPLSTTTASPAYTLNAETQTVPSGRTCHCDVFNGLMATIDAAGTSPVAGEVTVKQWIDSAQPQKFAKRHFEINSVQNTNTATAKVTLYFTQSDFDGFNAQSPTPGFLLPQNSTDVQGINNVRINNKKGVSSNNSGLPTTYSDTLSVIDPVDSDIVWNATQNRWEVSFDTTGFGGYWLAIPCLTPQIQNHPQSQTVCVGTNITLNVSATGDGLSYQWKKDGDNIGDGTSTLLLTNTDENTSGNYTVEITGECGNLISDVAVINVNQPVTYYADVDVDGYGNPASPVVSCQGAPEGTVLDNTDCNDDDIASHTTFAFYADTDGDGSGTGETVQVCAPDAQTAPEGFALNNTDCDDSDETVYQSGALYIDADFDGYSANQTAMVCYGNDVPQGYVFTATEMDCNDALASVYPGAAEVAYNGIDDNCNGTIDEGSQLFSKVLPTQCGTTLSAINSLIGAVSFGAPVDGYRFKVVDTQTLSQQTIDRNVPNFQLSALANYDYARTYSISVMLRRNGIWLNYYGDACLVSTPAILNNGGAAAVTPSQCGITLQNISTLIATTSLAGVTGYRFRITNMTDASAPNQVQTLDRNLHWFSLNMLETYTYGTSYTVEVAVKTNGSFSAFGSPCTVTTPAVPALVNCGAILATQTTFVYTSSMNRVSSYRFELTNMNDFNSTVVDRPTHYFSFNNVPGYAPGAQYAVRVAVMSSGVWSQFGDTCIITSPAAASRGPVAQQENTPVIDLRAVAYPNPYSESFALDMDTSSDEIVHVKVYDMTGRILENRDFAVDAIEMQQFGERYPSGVYNVILTQGSFVKTLRVIKR